VAWTGEVALPGVKEGRCGAVIGEGGVSSGRRVSLFWPGEIVPWNCCISMLN